MNTEFKEAFNRFRFLKLTDLIALFGICSFNSFKKGDFLAKEGEYCRYAYLIRKGIVRTFLLTPEGDQRTIRLAGEKEFTSAAQSFLNGEPSMEFLEAVEDCRVIQIDTKRLYELAESNIRILKLTHEGIKEAFSDAIKRIEFFTVLTPEQRYKSLLETSPDLLQRVPQKYLASFLGITTVSLSRIRNRK